MNMMGHFSPSSLVCLFLVVLVHCSRECRSEDFHTVSSDQALEAEAGADVILPCAAEPRAVGPEDLTVEWIVLGHEERTDSVHTFKNGRDRNKRQMASYQNRTALFHDELQNGNMSLKLSVVKASDSGDYICVRTSRTGQHYAIVKLTVRARVRGSKPEISSDFCEEGWCRLVCESSGWNPKPTADWLDDQQRNLNSEVEKVTLEPEDGYTVKRRLLVAEGGNSTFTCRVSEKEHVVENTFHI